jgi:hypothetical protein
VVPSDIKRLSDDHLQLLPKGYYTQSVALDEDVYSDYKLLQQKLFSKYTNLVFVE